MPHVRSESAGWWRARVVLRERQYGIEESSLTASTMDNEDHELLLCTSQHMKACSLIEVAVQRREKELCFKPPLWQWIAKLTGWNSLHVTDV